MPGGPTRPQHSQACPTPIPRFTGVVAQWLDIAPPAPHLAASQFTMNEMDGVVCATHVPELPSSPTPETTLLALPDELIGLCLTSLDASDLVRLQMVSRRLYSVVQRDSLRWRQVVQARWPAPLTNQSVLVQAAAFAGGWKALYAEKHVWDRTRLPWTVPSESEIRAFIEIIKAPLAAVTAASAEAKGMAHSPTSVTSQVGPLGSPVEQPGLSVAILVDGSSSVTEEDFAAMKSFSTTFLDSLARTHPQSSACLIQFNQYPRVEQTLVSVADGAPKAAVQRMEQMMGSTDIAAPIRRAHETLADTQLERRRDRVILMLTDGQTHAEELRLCERQVKAAADELGTRIFTIGVGRDVDQAGLERIALAGHPEHPIHSKLPAVQGEAAGCYFTLRRLKK